MKVHTMDPHSLSKSTKVPGSIFLTSNTTLGTEAVASYTQSEKKGTEECNIIAANVNSPTASIIKDRSKSLLLPFSPPEPEEDHISLDFLHSLLQAVIAARSIEW